MSYEKLEMLKSDPVVETTAFTMKSIKEILAETGDLDLLQSAPDMSKSGQPAVAPLQRPSVQSTVEPRRVSVVPQRDAVPMRTPGYALPPQAQDSVPEVQPSQNSLAGRMAAKLFGRR